LTNWRYRRFGCGTPQKLQTGEQLYFRFLRPAKPGNDTADNSRMPAGTGSGPERGTRWYRG